MEQDFSAVADEPRDALCHGQRVVNRRAFSVTDLRRLNTEFSAFYTRPMFWAVAVKSH